MEKARNDSQLNQKICLDTTNGSKINSSIKTNGNNGNWLKTLHFGQMKINRNLL